MNEERRAAFEATCAAVSPPMHQQGVRCDQCEAGPLAHWWSQVTETESRTLCETCLADVMRETGCPGVRGPGNAER
jgi:hypothetical protein